MPFDCIYYSAKPCTMKQSRLIIYPARLIVLSCILFLFNAMRRTDNFSSARDEFVSNVSSFNIPYTRLSYKDNLQLIAGNDTLQKELAFFTAIKEKLSKVNPNTLTAAQRMDYEIMQYQDALNLERIKLEQRWNAGKPAVVGDEGLYNLPIGKELYAYYLKKWIGDEVTPQQIFDFGLQQIKRAQDGINNIRRQLNMDEKTFYEHLNASSFYVTSETAIYDSFAQTKKIVLQNLDKLFLHYEIPEARISKGAIRALVQTPGYYSSDTFYFNLFDKPYCTRQFAWLFIHEGIPGHHLQVSLERSMKKSPVQQLFRYSGYAEGWGAYAEEYGKELGAYKNIYDEMGKWEWDIVRSVRLPLDVGINYLGWTNEQALAFWKKNIVNQDAIAMREIERVRRWPCQVACYKYGAAKFIEWRDRLQKKEGARFDIRQYHDLILKSAGLPFFMIEKKINSYKPVS